MLVRSYKDVAAIPIREGVEKGVVIRPKEGAPTFVMRIFDQAPNTSTDYHSHDWEHEVFVLDSRCSHRGRISDFWRPL